MEWFSAAGNRPRCTCAVLEDKKKMIDIGTKKVTRREAVVGAKICLKDSVILAIKKKKIPKGDVLEAARLAGIMAAKKTPDIIHHCHPISIEYTELDFFFRKNDIKITATVKANAKTGVEMEAFTAAAVAALTIYDMCKAFDREAVISEIELLKKSGGKSGTYDRNSK